MPDALDGVDDQAELPRWCIYVAEADGDCVLGGVWMHLEHDTNTGRPELRVLLDTNPEMGLAGLLAIPLHLDCDKITEANFRLHGDRGREHRRHRCRRARRRAGRH
ncbi:hypothetical protein [Micromonospora chalcea]|uniref:hypothetical protein n=1 Tax=Micromonospora chalcea TaxID=1874 RepID=UPI0033D39972